MLNQPVSVLPSIKNKKKFHVVGWGFWIASKDRKLKWPTQPLTLLNWRTRFCCCCSKRLLHSAMLVYCTSNYMYSVGRQHRILKQSCSLSSERWWMLYCWWLLMSHRKPGSRMNSHVNEKLLKRVFLVIPQNHQVDHFYKLTIKQV